MDAKKPLRCFANTIGRVDLVPAVRELPEPPERISIARVPIIPSRSRRAKAETHSTSEPHQTSIAESFTASDRKRWLDGSRTSNGTIAEASQNLTGYPAALR